MENFKDSTAVPMSKPLTNTIPSENTESLRTNPSLTDIMARTPYMQDKPVS